MSMATRTDTQSPTLHVADSHDLIRVLGAPRGRDPEAPRAEAKENQTCCSKLVRSSQATPTPDREGGPA